MPKAQILKTPIEALKGSRGLRDLGVQGWKVWTFGLRARGWHVRHRCSGCHASSHGLAKSPSASPANPRHSLCALMKVTLRTRKLPARTRPSRRPRSTPFSEWGRDLRCRRFRLLRCSPGRSGTSSEGSNCFVSTSWIARTWSSLTIPASMSGNPNSRLPKPGSFDICYVAISSAERRLAEEVYTSPNRVSRRLCIRFQARGVGRRRPAYTCALPRGVPRYGARMHSRVARVKGRQNRVGHLAGEANGLRGVGCAWYPSGSFQNQPHSDSMLASCRPVLPSPRRPQC